MTGLDEAGPGMEIVQAALRRASQQPQRDLTTPGMEETAGNAAGSCSPGS